MLGGTTFVAAAAVSYSIDGLPPVLWVSVTARHSEPPGGMTSASCGALVLTFKGFAVLPVALPNDVDQVLPTLGTVATKPAQLAVADTPAETLTVSLVDPLPPFQYIVKVHTPAATAWAGSELNANTVVTPPD